MRWDQYVTAINTQFSSKGYEDSWGDLKNLTQDGELTKYVDVFDDLMNRVDVSEGVVVGLFLRDLNEEIWHHVWLLNLQTILNAYNLARLQEANCKATRCLQRGIGCTPKVGTSSICSTVGHLVFITTPSRLSPTCP